MLAPLASSDHSVVEFDLLVQSWSSFICPRPDFANVDFALLSQHLSSVDWWSVFDKYSSVSELYERFCKVLYSALALFVPFKVPRVNHVKYPKHIHNLLCQKERLFHENRDALSSSLYKKVCADINYHLVKFLDNYERRLSHSRSARCLYQYVRRRMKNTGSIPTIVDEQSNPILSDNEKACRIAEYFASVFSAGQDISLGDSNLVNAENRHPLSEFDPTFYFHPEDIFRILGELKPSCSEPWDGIPQIIFKKCRTALSKPLAHIFNMSLFHGEVPYLWKQAIVTALPKRSGSCSVTDFRPISLTPTPVKVMEKIVSAKIFSFLKERSIIAAEQHGFMPGASTLTNLIDL